MTDTVWATWDDVLDDASAPGLSAEERCRLLAAICIAALRISKESLTQDRPGGFPRGRPNTAATRTAAARLMQLADSSGSSYARGYETLGTLLSVYQPVAATSGVAVDERHHALHAVQQACEQADPADSILFSLAHLLLGGRYASVRDYERSLLAYDTAIRALTGVDLYATDHWFYDVAPFLVKSAEPGVAHRIAFRGRLYKPSRLLDLGLVQQAKDSADELVEFTRARLPEGVGDYAWALTRHARVDRERRAVQAFIATEGELKDLAESLAQGTGKRAAQVYWWGCAANNAQKLGDFARSSEYFRRRIAFRAHRDLGIEIDPGNVNSHTIAPLISEYHRLGSTSQLTNIGNDAYDIALNLFYSGILEVDATARTEALRLLDLVERAWKDFAVNGVYALSLSRTRIHMIDSAADIPAATATCLQINDEAVRFNTKRRALVVAVRYGQVGSPQVLNRLHTSIDALDATHAFTDGAYLHGLLAEFWLRFCTSEETAGRPGPWAEAESAALTAAPLLRPDGVSLDPELEAVVWQAAAAAITAPELATEKLDRLLRAICSVAELMVTIANFEERRTVATRFAPLYVQAADLARTLDDHEASDLIMEAVRRDRVGLLLAGIIANPSISDDIRAAALAISDSSRRAPEEPSVDDIGDEEDYDGLSADEVRSRSSAILDDRAQATRAAEQVLGPLGALCDPLLLRKITARVVLTSREITQPTAILQLLPMPEADAAGDHVVVYQRLTYTVRDEIYEYLDTVQLPRSVLHLEPGHSDTFRDRDTFRRLLPQPLHALCRAASTDAPVRLMIVPTGLFQIPFELIPVGAAPLIHKAAVTLHGSLTSMHSQIQLELEPARAPSLAVYDTVQLRHTQGEYDALVQHVPQVRRVTSADELNTALDPGTSARAAVLAMGVHGEGDDHGWGQTKIMPDRTLVAAADVLSWDAPRLCVLASCHTALTTFDGRELGGFPLALMLRGATTVIGGLFRIPDKSTSEIMTLFWADLGRGHNAVTALRQAKLTWLAQHAQQHDPQEWTGLITYGAATC
ncbi:CHAT domain-containing protein [Nocardia gipuzkoensis]